MSYERDRRHREPGHGPGGTTQPIAPGKVTLTQGLHGGVAPVQQRGDRIRDLSAPDEVDQGARAPKPPVGGRVANPSSGNVAATVVGSTADTDVAFDNSFTPALVAALRANPSLSIDEILEQLSADSIGAGIDHGGPLYHPTIVQYGQRAQATSKGGDNKKHAVLIGNQNYVHMRRLGTPIAEAGAMQSELASRGYDASVHHDKSAADMSALWGSLVGSARPGDDLVAFYGGHGLPEGLVGIDHALPPNPPDILGNAEVSGVVSSATGKGAQIRFVMDSCYAGSAVQTVREERQNELAAAAGSFGDVLRVAALTSLQQAKKRLVALCEQRRTTPHQLDEEILQHESRAPDPSDAEATREWTQIRDVLLAARPKVRHAFDLALDRLWTAYAPVLNMVKMAAHYLEEPPAIEDHATLAAQLNYLDDLWNAVSQPMERATAKPGAAPAAHDKK